MVKGTQEVVKPLQKSATLPAGWALIVICTFGAALGAFFAAAIVQEPLAIAALAGVLISWAVGIGIVAPRAGRIAYEKILHGLADPSPEEVEMLQHLSVNIMGNISQIARHKEARVMFKPIFDVAMESLDQGIDKSLANISSQVSKGIGAFSPENGGDMKQIVSEIFMPTIDGFLDSMGATDALKKKIHVKLATKMAGVGGGHTQGAPGGGGGW